MQNLLIEPRSTCAISGGSLRRPEGVAFSRDGTFVALADPDTNRVSFHARRGEAGSYDPNPVSAIEGRPSGLVYPHDVDFSPDDGLAVVANRVSSTVTIYARARDGSVRYGPRPVWTIGGPASELSQSDGARFAPPTGDFLAVVNRTTHAVTFFRRERGWLGGVRFSRRPCFQLRGLPSRIFHPDGIAFSPDGRLLAVSNHGVHSVTIYGRGERAPEYRAEPIAEIRGDDSRLRYPHSLAFSPDGAHLAVSNAGGRTVGVFRHGAAGANAGAGWSSSPAFEIEACDPGQFDAVNDSNAMEGGCKGVAFGGDCFAFCNNEIGLRVHRVRT